MSTAGGVLLDTTVVTLGPTAMRVLATGLRREDLWLATFQAVSGALATPAAIVLPAPRLAKRVLAGGAGLAVRKRTGGPLGRFRTW
jgi:hypothetical protein